MSLNVKLRKNKLLKQDADLLRRENDLLRQQKEHAEGLVAEFQAEQEECASCDMDALRNQRKFLEYRIDKEKRLHQRLCDSELEKQFIADCKYTLLCHLRDFQLSKICMAEAELAKVVFEIWRCKTLNTDDQLGCIIVKIDCELENCEDPVNPFVADLVKDVLKDC